MSFIGDIFGGKKAGKVAGAASVSAANDAATAIEKGTEMAVAGQTEALDYLKERDKLPREISERALSGLSEYYKLPQGNPRAAKTQAELISEAKSSPLYASILGSRKSGEDAYLRNASATGKLRSGNSIGGLTDYSMQLENNALLSSYDEAQQRDREALERDDYLRALNLQGIGGLAGLQGYGGDIASGTAGIGATQGQGVINAGQTRSQGKIASAQAIQQGQQNSTDTLTGLGSIAALAFCDLRLKINVRFIGYRNRRAWYSWDWIPEAVALGLQGSSEGVLAHQVYETDPDAVGTRAGFLVVDYDKLGITRAAA